VSASVLVPFVNVAIANPIGYTTAPFSSIMDQNGSWTFNHKLTADEVALAINLPRIRTGRRRRSAQAQQGHV